MKFVLDLWPEDGDHQLTPAQAVGRAIDAVRDRGEELAWDVRTDEGELIAEVTPDDLAKLKRVLVWESAGHNDEPGDQNASSDCVEHGHWSLGPQGDGTWGVGLIEQDADLTENPAGGIHLGHFASEEAAKDAADQYEREHRDDRNVWSVPILLHIEAKTASGAVDKVWNTIVGDGSELTISDGSSTVTVYANGPMDPAAFGGTQHIYTLDKEGKPE